MSEKEGKAGREHSEEEDYENEPHRLYGRWSSTMTSELPSSSADLANSDQSLDFFGASQIAS